MENDKIDYIEEDDKFFIHNQKKNSNSFREIKYQLYINC